MTYSSRFVSSLCTAATFCLCPEAAAGNAFSANFSVLTPGDDEFAQKVLLRAEEYRREIAVEWLGSSIPDGVGRALINVVFATDDRGSTWAIDNEKRSLHAVYISTPRDRVLGGTLKHEICHVVMATRFPHPRRLPVWLEEGIASRYDEASRKQTRKKICQWWKDTGQYPSIDRVLSADRMPSYDTTAHAASEECVDYLLRRFQKTAILKQNWSALEATVRTNWRRITR